MKILVITQLYPQPDDIGDNKPTRTVEYFAKEWVEEGNEVIVVHCPSKFPLPFYYVPSFIKNKLGGASSNIIPPVESRKKLFREEYGIKVFRKPMFKWKPGNGYSSNNINKVSDEIVNDICSLDFTPDLVVGHFANPSTAIVANLAKRFNVPSSIVFHHDCTSNNIKKYNLLEHIRDIGAIGVRSTIEAQDVKERLALSDLPFICYSGVPNNAVLKASDECIKMDFSRGIEFLYVGSFIKRKHLDKVINAFSTIVNGNDKLTIVGGGPEESTVKELIQTKCCTENINLIGRVDRDKVLEYMKAAHIFTLISDGETYGMVYAEAMLQGCIVVASRRGGFDGIIKDGVNGFLCEPGNEEELKSIYRRIKLLSVNERNAIGLAAINTAKHLSEKEVAVNYLNDILRQNKRSHI